MEIPSAITLGLCFALTLPVVHAEELPTRGPIPFGAYDKDKNGTISKDEFYATRGERMGQRATEGAPMRGLAGAPAFEEFDADGDGQLTEAELKTGQQAQQRSGSGTVRGRGAGAGTGRNMPSFQDYDINADGKLTEQEFNEGRAKRIEERAREGGQMRNLPSAPVFTDLDANVDGVVTPEEFTAHQRQQPGVPADPSVKP